MGLIKNTPGYEKSERKVFEKGTYNVVIQGTIGSDGVDKDGNPRVAKIRPDGVVSNWVIVRMKVDHGDAQQVNVSKMFWLPDTSNFTGEKEDLDFIEESYEKNSQALTNLFKLATGKEMPAELTSVQLAIKTKNKKVSVYVYPETEKVIDENGNVVKNEDGKDKYQIKTNDQGYVQYTCSTDFEPVIKLDENGEAPLHQINLGEPTPPPTPQEAKEVEAKKMEAKLNAPKEETPFDDLFED